VVFSFFKKGPKDNRPRPAREQPRGPARPAPARTTAKPAADAGAKALSRASLPSTKFATTENAIGGRDLARSLAMETAAKIDQIESEMARDFLRPAANTLSGSPSAGGAVRGAGQVAAPVAEAARPAAGAVARSEATRMESVRDDLDPNADDFGGNIDAIEIGTSGAGPVIDETAILFANGQDAEAEATLRAGIEADDLGPSTQTGWLMLFELVNQRGDRAAFEQLTMRYALRFENSPPAWCDYVNAVAAKPSGFTGPAPQAESSPTVPLPAAIDAAIVKPMEQLKALAAQHPALAIDLSATRSVDPVGAELLLRVVSAFKRSSHELTLIGLENLLNPLRAIVEPGRRDATDAAWMLLLEVLRLLNRQNDFEETAIQYCITFEVSPPSWEAAPANIRLRSARPVATGAALPAQAAHPLDWRGAIGGEGEPWIGRLLAEARTAKQLGVECRYLQRVGFSAASALLSQLLKLQQAGVSVEFRNVNYLVGALFQLLGITAVADVRLRRA
jgi:anti-anti-sigma regulatory factor